MQDTATPQADGYFGEDMKVDVGDYSLDALDAEEDTEETLNSKS